MFFFFFLLFSLVRASSHQFVCYNSVLSLQTCNDDVEEYEGGSLVFDSTHLDGGNERWGLRFANLDTVADVWRQQGTIVGAYVQLVADPARKDRVFNECELEIAMEVDAPPFVEGEFVLSARWNSSRVLPRRAVWRSSAADWDVSVVEFDRPQARIDVTALLQDAVATVAPGSLQSLAVLVSNDPACTFDVFACDHDPSKQYISLHVETCSASCESWALPVRNCTDDVEEAQNGFVINDSDDFDGGQDKFGIRFRDIADVVTAWRAHDFLAQAYVQLVADPSEWYTTAGQCNLEVAMELDAAPFSLSSNSLTARWSGSGVLPRRTTWRPTAANWNVSVVVFDRPQTRINVSALLRDALATTVPFHSLAILVSNDPSCFFTAYTCDHMAGAVTLHVEACNSTVAPPRASTTPPTLPVGSAPPSQQPTNWPTNQRSQPPSAPPSAAAPTPSVLLPPVAAPNTGLLVGGSVGASAGLLLFVVGVVLVAQRKCGKQHEHAQPVSTAMSTADLHRSHADRHRSSSRRPSRRPSQSSGLASTGGRTGTRSRSASRSRSRNKLAAAPAHYANFTPPDDQYVPFSTPDFQQKYDQFVPPDAEQYENLMMKWSCTRCSNINLNSVSKCINCENERII